MNFRNYERLDLDFDQGMVLIQGENGHGKSNLLEAMYMFAIAKSPRAATERELVRWGTATDEGHTQIAADVVRNSDDVRVQFDFRSWLPDNGSAEAEETISVQKYMRVNGVSRRASDLVGQVNAVLFTADDLGLVLGSPSGRRKYIDILISQLDRSYLRASQRYQQVLTQRNHLLKSIRESRSNTSELDFWDGELASVGGGMMAARSKTLAELSQIAAPIHQDITGGKEELKLVYQPSVDVDPGADEALWNDAIRDALVGVRPRELTQGTTVIGPHRDDLRMLLDGSDAGLYASRGQCRTVVLAMKLGEVDHLEQNCGQRPIVLLDDVLSELDNDRRVHVLERATQYGQCFITTAEPAAIEDRFLSRMSRFSVLKGKIEPVKAEV